MSNKRKQINVYVNSQEYEQLTQIQKNLMNEGKERSMSLIVREMYLESLKRGETVK